MHVRLKLTFCLHNLHLFISSAFPLRPSASPVTAGPSIEALIYEVGCRQAGLVDLACRVPDGSSELLPYGLVPLQRLSPVHHLLEGGVGVVAGYGRAAAGGGGSGGGRGPGRGRSGRSGGGSSGGGLVGVACACIE